jgi:hypothetical protein
VVYSGSGAITGIASVVVYPTAIWAGNAAVNASVTVTANGQIIGQEWTDVPAVPNTWTEQSPSSNIWTTVNPIADTWYANILADPYVEFGYWELGYTDERYEFWIPQTASTDTWARQ